MKLFISFFLIILTSSFLNNPVQNKQTLQNKIERIDSLMEFLNNPNDKHILVAAHRADWRNYPENSLESVVSCVAMGVDIVEIDIHKTKDGHLIVMHDKTVDRTTNGTGKISDFTLEEIQKLYLKNAYAYTTKFKIPLLEEVLLAVKGKAFLFIDKAYKYIPEAYKIIEKTGTQKEALFEGLVTLETLKAEYPDFVGKIKYMPRLNGDKKNIETLNYVNDYVNSKTLVASFILSFSKENSPGIYYSTEIRSKGISVMANALWPESCADHDDDLSALNPNEGWGWLIKHGANIICTDRPQLLINYLDNHDLHQ